MGETFRPARPSDLDALVVLMRPFYAGEEVPFDETVARRVLTDIQRHPDLGRAWLIHEGDALVGYIIVTLGFSPEYHGRDAFLEELFILPEHRHRGLGTRAMAFVEAACREMSVNALHLEVVRRNTRAQAFYRHLGYEDHDRYLMTRWLGPRYGQKAATSAPRAKE